jgi:hypothetical protein
MQQLVAANPVFRQIDSGRISEDFERTRMPLNVSGEDIQILSVLKGMVGQDLTRVSMPGINLIILVTINEPLSILQKLCELMYYSPLLDKANL